MKLVAVSQRVTEIPAYGERRDSLDQRWFPFLEACGLLPLLIPNHKESALRLLSAFPVEGVILTGGNDLAKYGGDAPERDETERMLIQYGVEHSLPVIGVCRGMQMILDFFGVELIRVEGHAGKMHAIEREFGTDLVNSYHNMGVCRRSSEVFDDWAKAEDGVIEGISHRDCRIVGIMWHPERFPAFRPADLRLFRQTFEQAGGQQ